MMSTPRQEPTPNDMAQAEAVLQDVCGPVEAYLGTDGMVHLTPWAYVKVARMLKAAEAMAREIQLLKGITRATLDAERAAKRYQEARNG